jgi:hypothetical protein
MKTPFFQFCFDARVMHASPYCADGLKNFVMQKSAMDCLRRYTAMAAD